MIDNATQTRRCRFLVVKPGLDSHDRGARILSRGLMDAGFEVIYGGTCVTPDQIAKIASDEDVCVVCLSMHVGAHIAQTQKVLDKLRDNDGEDIAVVCGGIIPRFEAVELRHLGVDAVAEIGMPMDDAISLIGKSCKRHNPQPEEVRSES